MNGPFETRESPHDGALMVRVAAGPFLMGLPAEDLFAEDHEKPQRTVVLEEFWIDVHPVTNARFTRFLEAGGYNDPRWWVDAGWAWRQRHGINRPARWGESGWDAPEQPVAGVSWYEADAYARWAGGRLPTDAEWEKAARGTDGRRYPWGDAWPWSAAANFDDRLGRPTVIGLFPEGVSPYGCLDMAGNVNNWTADWYWPGFGAHCATHGLLANPILDDETRDRLGLTDLTDKVDRGGGFATPLYHHEVLGCTRKVHWPPTRREPWNGFRTASAP